MKGPHGKEETSDEESGLGYQNTLVSTKTLFKLNFLFLEIYTVLTLFLVFATVLAYICTRRLRCNILCNVSLMNGIEINSVYKVLDLIILFYTRYF